MTLDPTDIQTLADALALRFFWASLGGLTLGLLAGFLLNWFVISNRIVDRYSGDLEKVDANGDPTTKLGKAAQRNAQRIIKPVELKLANFDSQTQRVEQAIANVEASVKGIAIPKVPTAAEVFEAMRHELTKLIEETGAVDVEALAAPIRAQVAAMKFDLAPLVPVLVAAMKEPMQGMLNSLLTDEYRAALMKNVRGHRGEKREAQENELVEVMADAMQHPEEAAKVKAGLDLFGPILKKQGIDPQEQLRLVKAARTLLAERQGTAGAGGSSSSGRAPGVP